MPTIHSVPNDDEQDAQYDPYDPQSLCDNGTAPIDVESVLTAVPVRKPKRTEFVRVHSGDDYMVPSMRVLERDTGMDTESYLVTRQMQHLVSDELRQVRLYTAITKRGTVFLWPIKLPGDSNDRIRRISDTAIQCAEQAKKLWVKVRWDRDLGGYAMQRATGELGEPQWPGESLRDLIEKAFQHNLIDRPDHPVIMELSGEL
jgi:hypothetical protein